MPVRVKIPIRLRVEPDTLDHAEIDSALRAALGRALTQSKRRVVAPRGGVLDVVSHEPEFAWGGAGLAQVSATARRRTEARIRAAISRALADSGLLDGGGRRPEVLPADIAERVDTTRLRVLGYLTPSYGGDAGDQEQVGFDPSGDDTIIHPGKYNFEWAPADLLDVDPALFRDQFLRSVMRERGAIPTTGIYGAVLYVGKTDKIHQRFVFMLFDFAKPGAPDFSAPDYAFHGDIGASHFDVKKHDFVPIEAAMPTVGEYELRKQYTLGSDDDRLVLVHDYLEDELRETIAADPELGANVDENVKQAKLLAAKALAAYQSALLIVTPVDGRFAITMNETLPMPQLPVKMYPVNAASFKLPLGDGGDAQGPGKSKGDGAGKKAKGKGKQGKGDGFDEGHDEGEGGFIVDPNATGDGKARFAFPPGEGGTLELVCAAFEDEPPVDEWKNADAIKRLIHTIAARLAIPECQYPGTFCINAATVIGGRASGVAQSAIGDTAFTADMKPADGFIVRPIPTIAVQFFRHLAGTVPYLSALQNLFFEERGAAWQLHFREAYAPALRESIGWMFMYTCQVAFLQQLRYSRTQIDLRVDKFDKGYADFFQETVLQLLTDVASLGLLREQLIKFLAANLDSVDAVARAAVDAWRREHRDFEVNTEIMQDVAAAGGERSVVQPKDWDESQSFVFGLLTPVASATGITSSKGKGTVAKKHGDWAIRDADGRLWTLKELDMAIALQNGTAESVDPLVKQILDVDGMVPLFKANPWMIKEHLRRLLADMQDKNTDITDKVTGSATWAFEKGPISEDIEHASVPYCKYALGGIHLAAHSLIYDAFGGDEEYAEALNDLFDSISGWRDIKQFFLIGGILILCVLCPEAAAIVGIIQAEGEREDAAEMKDVYRSLIDPDVVISKAELEVQQFMAELMLAVSIIPEAGNIIKGATGLAEAALKGTVKQFAKEALESILKQVIKQLEKNLAKAFVEEIVKFEVFGALMQATLAPLAKAIQEEASLPPVPAPTAADLGLQTADAVLAATAVAFDAMPENDVGEGD